MNNNKNNKPIALVLGGTGPHKALLSNLKNRGYYTVLIDYLEHPLAVNEADEHIRESTLDQEKVLAIAKKLKAQLVISTCVDQANLTACYVAEKLNLPAPYSYDIALTVTDKELMKEKMMHYGIPTSKYVCTNSLDTKRLKSLQFPVVVKPVDSCGSKGVKKADNIIELKEFFNYALENSRSKKVIVEEYVKGVEISIDCFIQNKKAHLILLKQKEKIIDKDKLIMQMQFAIMPAMVSRAIKQQILSIVNEIASCFKLNNTSLLVQVIIENDKVNVIEFAPRVGGGLGYRYIKLATGFDIIDATIESYFGNKVELQYHPSKFFYSSNIIYAEPGEFGSVKGQEFLIKEKIVKEFYLFKSKGMMIGKDITSSNRVGAYLIEAKTKKELFKKMVKAQETLEVFNLENHPIMKKNFFPKQLIY